MKKTISYFILCCFFCNTSHAQYCATKLYGRNEGIESPVISIFQHSDGAIWCGTQMNGVYRFDNQHFQNYLSTGGLKTDEVVTLFEDIEGNLWASNPRHGTSYITKQGTMVGVERTTTDKPVHDIYYNKKIQKITCGINTDNGAKSVYYDYKTNDFLLLDSLKFDLTQYETVKKSYWHLNLPNADRIAYLRDKKTKKEQFYLINTNTFEPWQLPKGVSIDDFLWHGVDENNQVIYVTTKGIYRKENENWQLKCNPKELIQYWKSSNIFFQYSNHSYNSVINNKDGTYTIYSLLDDLKTMQVYTFQFANDILEVGSIFKDQSNNFWIATTGGLLKVYPSMMTIPNNAPNMVTDVYHIIEDKKGKIWFGSYRRGAAYYDGKTIQAEPSFLKKLDIHYIAGNLHDDNGNMILMTENKGLMRFDGAKKLNTSIMINPKTQAKHFAGFYLYKTKNGKIAYGSAGLGLGIIENMDAIFKNKTPSWDYKTTEQGITTGNVLTITEDFYGRLWFGRPTKGIGVYDPVTDQGVTFQRKEVSLDYGAMASVTDSYGNIWFGTDKGLCFFTPPSTMPKDSTFDFRNKLQRISVDWLGTSLVTYLKIWQDKYLVVGNALGMSLIDIAAFYRTQGKKVPCYILKDYGSPFSGSGQNSVCIDSKNQVWGAGEEGVIRFDPNLLVIDTVIEKVSINSMSISYPLRFSTNNLLSIGSEPMYFFVHTPINPLFNDNIKYRYRLTKNDAWTYFTDNKITLTNLAAGVYCLEIQAVKNGIESEITTMRLIVLPWLILFFIFLGFIITLGSWFYFKKQKEIIKQKQMATQQQQQILTQQQQLLEKETEIFAQKREHNKLRAEAIVNQLNPHFINNTLSWLQSIIDGNDEAQDIVQKFAQNIGIVFISSRQKKSYHSLSMEFKLVKNYLIIQKKRFETRLNYLLPDQEIIDRWSSVKLPLMLLQIHTENAVEHGINKKKGGGVVTIYIKEQDKDYLKIEIEDNGIGREKAKYLESSGTQQGTRMLKELEEIFNKQNDLVLQSWYEDAIFTNENGEGYGTRVHIALPKKYNYEI